MIIKYISLFLLMCMTFISQNGSAQSAETEIIALDVQLEDTIADMDVINTFLDSLIIISHPADSVYQNWNTSDVKYREEDIKPIGDSIEIVLQDTLNLMYFVRPVPGNITSHYGYRRYRFHSGTDIDLITGDSVRAAFDGMVRFTNYEGGYGNVVVLRHGNGLETFYAHLSKILVDSNTLVKAGEIIGLGGNTGRSSGSHLHFEVQYLGKAFNSESIIDFEKGRVIADTVYICSNTFNTRNSIPYDKNATNYYVKSGDTLSGIGRKYNTSVNKLCYYNGIKETSVLQIGQKIRVK